jgi:pimeloyl-ACP methyl ester carboxylesterase
MSIAVIDGKVVRYEVFGRGQPVLFLHGWLGSWRYWFPTMKVVAEHFRTYSFDFLGFGHSQGSNEQKNIGTYSRQVVRFLDDLGIDRVLLVGHSMGGMVAMKTALDYPERVARVVTVGAPFQGKSLLWMLKLTSNPMIANTFARWSWLRRCLFAFFMGRVKDPAVEEILTESLLSSGSTINATLRSMLHTDLRPELDGLQVPAFIVHGGRDEIVSPTQVNLFDNLSLAEVLLMAESRHFPFLDDPDMFNLMLLQFLKQPFRQPVNRLRVPQPELTI